MQNNKLGRNITVFATFLAFMGMGVVDPILPEIAKKLGANHWQIEMLFTSYLLVMAFLMLPVGILAVKFGDKFIMTIGLALVSFFAISCSMSSSIFEISLFRAGWGLGNAMFFATALIMLITLSSDYHKAVGLFEGSVGFGIASGPLLGGFLGEHSWRYPFLATGVLALCSFLAVLFFVKAPKEDMNRKAISLNDLKNLFSNKKFLVISFATMFYFYGFLVVLAYSPLILNLEAIEIGFVFFAWGLALAIGSIFLSTKLEDKYPPSTLVPISVFIFAAILLSLMLVESRPILYLLIVVSGLLSGINNSLLTSYIMELKFEKNIISGGFNLIRWTGAALAPVLSGYIATTFRDMRLPFLVAFILAFISFLMLYILKKAK